MARGAGIALTAAAGVALMSGLAGCVASHPSGPHGPHCEQIESASHIIDHPIQRFRMLKSIAGEPNLTQHEQTYLVNAIFPVFASGFGSDQADASIRLIQNPCCTPETRTRIRERLKTVKILGQEARRILIALDDAEAGAARQPAGSQPARAAPPAQSGAAPGGKH